MRIVLKRYMLCDACYSDLKETYQKQDPSYRAKPGCCSVCKNERYVQPCVKLERYEKPIQLF